MENFKKSSHCSITNCSSYRLVGVSTHLRFFRFPRKGDKRLMLWKLACGDEDIMNKNPESLHRSNRICSEHFEPHLMTGFRLHKTAVPTLKLFHKTKKDMETQTINKVKDAETQTPKYMFKSKMEEMSSNELSNSEEAMDIMSKEAFKKACDVYLPKKFGDMIKLVCDLHEKK